MLYTDAEFLSATDLQGMDSEILAVAAAEKMTLSSVIAQGSQEAGQRILSRIQSAGGNYASTSDLSWNHLSAVLGAAFTGNASRISLGQIVVNNPKPGYLSAVKLYVAYSVLVLFYRQASNRMSKNVDRYQSKRDDYRNELNRTYWPMLQAQGLPWVYTPLPCPAAIHEPNTGAWAASASGAGSLAAAGSYDVTITWVGAAYVSALNNANAESGPAAIQSVGLASNQYIHVDITGLNPPSANPSNPVPPGYSGVFPVMPTTGWNVYAGPSGGPLKLVNPVPLPISTKAYNADPGAVLGALVGTGQYPNAQLPIVTTIMRA